MMVVKEGVMRLVLVLMGRRRTQKRLLLMQLLIRKRAHRNGCERKMFLFLKKS